MKLRPKPEPGAAVTAVVPASSANLGPGFDSLALALDVWDDYSVVVRDSPGIVVDVVGESALEVPLDETHLVASALLSGLQAFGTETAGIGLHLRCENRIPHGRGLGSSASAIVGGVRLAAQLAGVGSAAEVLQVAARLEGHPDNAAAALFGGFVISWMEGETAGAVTCDVHRRIRPVTFVPDFRSPTSTAREVLPERLRHTDAAFNASRAALLVHAITADPSLLLAATEDRMHQEQRRASYPRAMALVDRLRERGIAAVISGAGPSVLALVTTDELSRATDTDHGGFRCDVSAIVDARMLTEVNMRAKSRDSL